MTAEELKSYIQGLGVSDIGFSNVSGHIPDNWSTYPYGITFVIQLSTGLMNDISSGPTETYFSHYRNVNAHLNEIMLKTTIFLQNHGFDGIPIPASQSLHNQAYNSVFPHKMAATLSGLGWIGKSDLFIHNKYGPRVRLGTVLTDMILPVGKPTTESFCGNCRLCIDACPTMAIQGVNWKQGMERNELYDAHGCSTYMKEHFQHIGRGAVCGICISACPVGKSPKDNG